MAHRMHRGGVLGFVLVGVLLLALVAGGIYLVRHQLIAKNTPESGKEVADNTAAPDKPADSGETTNTDTSTDLEKALQSQSEAEKKAREQKEAQEKKDVAAGAASNAQTTPSSSAAAHLPETGPEDTLVTVLGAMLLSGALFAYVRSRALI